MRAWSPWFVACVFCASNACGQDRGGAVDTALRFFDANQNSRCAEAFSLYTKATQGHIRDDLRRYDRERDGEPSSYTPETRYCDPTKKMKPGTARIVRQGPGEAIVSRGYTVGHWIDKFIRLGNSYIDTTEEVRLVHEDGAWRVDRKRDPPGMLTPSVRERFPDEQVVEVGPVDVSVFPRNRLGQDIVDATVVAHVVPLKVIDVLRDPVTWAGLLPLVQSVEVLESAPGSKRLKLAFAGWDRPLIIKANIPSEVWSNDALGKSSFDAGHNAPVMFFGWWELGRHYDGTRVSLHIIMNKRQWPGDLGERFMSPERIAESLLGLEKAALK